MCVRCRCVAMRLRIHMIDRHSAGESMLYFRFSVATQKQESIGELLSMGIDFGEVLL